MKFLTQITEPIDIEVEMLRQEIDHMPLCDDIKKDMHFLEDIESFGCGKYMDLIGDATPVGTIEFVEKFLSIVHNIPYMAPIEIPEVLRKEEYLLREYRIIDADQVPWTGDWFIKDASRLKQFSYLGDMSMFMYDGIFDRPKENDYSLHLDKSHKFVLSKRVCIQSEYRAFVYNDDIKGIQFYNGNPLVMPTEDEIKKLRKMVSNYMADDTRPKAYAIDIAVIKTEPKSRDIVLIELCPFACVGTYGFSGNLPYMYRDGFLWYLQHNTQIN